MYLKVVLLIVINVFSVVFAPAQHVQVFTTGKPESFRGLSAVSDNVIWVSGTKGTVGKSLDGGTTWQWFQVKGYETRDFRDIEAFGSQTALVMAVAEPAAILLTQDGGKSWKEVYLNATKGMFLDAMDFWNDQHGIVLGDPIKGKFFVAQSWDGGKTWKEATMKTRPSADSGEACFAASGTNVRMLSINEHCFVSGGIRSQLFWKGVPAPLAIVQGKETTGANSVAVWKKTSRAKIVVVGGDFNNAGSREMNCSLSRDGGTTWIKPSNPPYGYRSCVEYVTEEKLVSCGINGVDISLDEGINWNSVSETGFHVCRKAKRGSTVFLAGAEGRIGKLIW